MDTITLTNMTEPMVEKLGEHMAARLFPGAFLALFGDLGAGKTAFTRALAAALGIEGITSPTFTIVQEHEGRIPLFHFDAYRLSSGDDLYAIGFEDYLARGGAIAMEWCENVMDALPRERLELHFSGSGDAPRTICIKACGSTYARFLDGLNEKEGL